MLRIHAHNPPKRRRKHQRPKHHAQDLIHASPPSLLLLRRPPPHHRRQRPPRLLLLLPPQRAPVLVELDVVQLGGLAARLGDVLGDEIEADDRHHPALDQVHDPAVVGLQARQRPADVVDLLDALEPRVLVGLQRGVHLDVRGLLVRVRVDGAVDGVGEGDGAFHCGGAAEGGVRSDLYEGHRRWVSLCGF